MAPAPVLLLAGAALQCCAAAAADVSIPVTAPGGIAGEIPATLSKPAGQGPFPALVIMHDCTGLGPQSSGSPGRWAQELAARGYVIVIPDSFTTRGFPAGVCTDPSPNRNNVAPYARVRDAYAALDYLRTLAYVDGARIGLMGGSHGGTTTLAAMSAPDNSADAGVRRASFTAAVALYPGCGTRMGSWRANATGVYRAVAPLLVLIGEKDDWMPAEPCRKLAAAAAGHPVAIKVYPGALHSFDNDRPVRYVATRMNANAPGGRGATTGGDPQAWADSIREVADFFGKRLAAH